MSSKFQPGPIGKHTWISKALIDVDNGPRGYQRPQAAATIARIRRNFKWAAFGVVLVSKRGERYFAFDGGTRTTCAKSIAGIDKVPCLVFSGLNRKEEAEIFLLINCGGKKPTPYERWRASLIAGDKTALEVRAVLDSFEMEMGKRQSLYVLSCFDTVLRLQRQEMLREILEIVIAAWPEDQLRTVAAVVEGMARLITKLRAENVSADSEEVIEVFSASHLSALLARARFIGENTNNSIKYGFFIAATEHWNKSRKAKRIAC